jgi:hypothetical protein
VALKPGPRDATLSSGGWRGRKLSRWSPQPSRSKQTLGGTKHRNRLEHPFILAVISQEVATIRTAAGAGCPLASHNIFPVGGIPGKRKVGKLQAGQRHRHLDSSCLVAEPPTRRIKMRFRSAISDSRCPRPHQPNSPLAPPRLSGTNTNKLQEERGRRNPRDTQTSMLGSLSSAYVSTRLHA